MSNVIIQTVYYRCLVFNDKKLSYYIALSTLPDLKHLVHTFTLVGVPLTIALTVLIFGSQTLLECLFE